MGKQIEKNNKIVNIKKNVYFYNAKPLQMILKNPNSETLSSKRISVGGFAFVSGWVFLS